MSTAASFDTKTTAGKIADLHARLDSATGDDSCAASARARVTAVLDAGSFVETDALAKHRATEFGADSSTPLTDGVVTGWGTIDGRRVCIYAQERGVFAGTMGEVHGEKILKIMDMAAKTGVPLVSIHDSDGPRMAEGVAAMSLYGKIVRAGVQLSGVVPQVSIIAGPTGGGHAFARSLGDLVVMVDGATLTGVDAHVTAMALGGDVDGESLGGARVHATTSGVAHATVGCFADAAAWVRDVVAFLPPNNRAAAPVVAPSSAAPTLAGVTLGALPGQEPGENSSTSEQATARGEFLNGVIPDSPQEAYDMAAVVDGVVDEGSILELSADYAPAIITAFARISGRSVGIVANQPSVNAGCLDSETSEKAARFVRLCDCFNIPVVVFVDSPGFTPGLQQEHDGMVRRGAKLLYAFAEATVGIITVITRKAHGAAFTAMGSKDIGADICLAWPTAQIAVADAATAVPVVFEQELAKARAKGASEEDIAEKITQLSADWEENMLTPYRAAERGLVDAVIEPSDTRHRVLEAVRLVERKVVALPAKKHGNIPL